MHTKNGLVSIEQILVGDLVLSQPEMKGELAYKRVVNTFVYEDKEARLLELFKDDNLQARSIVVRPNHPFWMKDVGWTRAENLPEGAILEVHDGSLLALWRSRELRNTEVKDIAWPCDFHPDYENAVEFREDSFVVDEEESQSAHALSRLGGWL